MFERSLNEAELILSTRKDPLVPVREVWEHVVSRSRSEGFEVASLVDFSAMLEGDQRFQIIPAQRKNQDDPEVSPDGEIESEEMENLGFFSEDRVRLRMSKAVPPAMGEEEEEVGSIRRRAFVSQKVDSKKIPARKDAIKPPKRSAKKNAIKKKKTSKSKKTKRSNPAPIKKSNKRKKGKR